MFDRRAKSAVPLAAIVLILCSRGRLQHHPSADRYRCSRRRTDSRRNAVFVFARFPVDRDLEQPTRRLANPVDCHTQQCGARTGTAPNQVRPARSAPTILAPPPVVLAGPAFAVSATRAPTAVSAPSTVGHWNICVPVTLHITNDTGAAITGVTVNPEIQSRSPGGQLDTLLTTPDYYAVAHLNLGNGSASVHVNACGYIYNGASQTVTYTGTAHMTGGYAAPGTPQQLPGPVGGMTVAISMS